jgi:magnesium transporter
MSTKTHVGRDARLDAAELHAIVDRPGELPETVSEAIEAEGSAGESTSDGQGQVFAAWLFREDADPREAALDELGSLAADDECFVWVDLSDYGAADLETVAKALDLPEAALRTALSSWQRPRVDVFGNCFFVAVTVPRGNLTTLRVLASELDLFVGRNYLVSAHKRALPFSKQVLARAVQNPALLKLDSAFLLSIFLDELLAHVEDLTEGLENTIETIEERALADSSDAFLEDLLRFKRFVFAVYRLAGQHRPVLEAFLRPDFPLVGGDAIEPYFRDLESRLGRLVDGLEAAKDAVNDAFDVYVSQISRRTNDIMKVLAIVSTLLLPATVILGFFGTNLDSPLLTTSTSFIVMILLIVLVTTGILVVFHRWGWLGRSRVTPAEELMPASGAGGTGGN